MDDQDKIAGKNLLEDENLKEASSDNSAESGIPEVKNSSPSLEVSNSSIAGKPSSLKSKKVVFGVVGILLVLLVVFLVFPLFGTVKSAQVLYGSINSLSTPLSAQDLGGIKSAIEQLEKDLKNFRSALVPLGWVQIVPVVGSYWSDANNSAGAGIAVLTAAKILIPAIEPYADVLGFGGTTVPSEPGAEGAITAEERIDFIVQALPALTPKLGEVSPQLREARDAIAQIDAARYPDNFRGIPLRRAVKDVQAGITTFTILVTDGKPLLEALPYLLGMDDERTYLVIFQNDKELRPTGGFMTAYSLMKVKEGKIQPVSSDDIYNLDKRYRTSLSAPQVLLDHIKQPYGANPGWRLRDMNWSPDFKVAMDLFLAEAKKARLPAVDGVIAVDTSLLVSILEVTGKIGVPGQGNFSAETDKRCDCPQVIYELESYADVEKPIVWDPNTGKIVFGEIVDNRKAILGPLVNSVIANALAQPKEKVPVLAQKVLANLLEKHVIFYMFDENTQRAFESFNIAGRMRDNGDYLAIVDANIAGRKANLYTTHDVTDEIEDKGDRVIHNLTLTYKNPQKHDGWLNSVLPNYMRVYVPNGAKLLGSEGAEIETSVDLGKTVFSGFFELRPEGVVKIYLKYELIKQKPYKMLIQKQSGKGTFNYTVTYKGRAEEFQLATDRELHFE